MNKRVFCGACSKVSYMTQSAADKAANKCMLKFGSDMGKYPCPHGLGFHLTHKCKAERVSRAGPKQGRRP